MMTLILMMIMLLLLLMMTMMMKFISNVCLTDDTTLTSTERGCYEELIHYATCPSCEKITTNMKILPCMDYCCLPCLQQQLSQCNELVCPSCRQALPVLQQGLEDLPSNTYIRAVVPALADVEPPVPVGDRPETPCCGGCSSRTTTTKFRYCRECRQHLCEQCAKVHRNLRSTQTHRVVGQRQSPLVDSEGMMCCCHPTKTVQAFCGDCSSLCCVACLQQVHRDHNWSDVDQVYQTFRQQLNGDMETVRRAASRCEQDLQQLEDAEKMLHEQVLAVKSETNSQRDQLIDAIDREIAQLHDNLEHDISSHMLHQNKEQIRKQKQILQCFEKFCQNVIETGTAEEVIHVYNSIHKTGEELPLQQVSNNVEFPHLRFTAVNVRDFLPEHAQRLIGFISVGHPSDENTAQHLTWSGLQSLLQQKLQQLDELHQQITDNQDKTACLEGQLAEKTELLEEARKELEEKKSLLVEMTSDVKEKENTVNSLTEELQQRDDVLDERTKQVEGLSHQLLETEQNFQSRLDECESKLEKTTIDLQESERSAAEYCAAFDQLNVRVQQLEESLSQSVNKEDEMETQLEDAWQQISEQHVPPTAGQFYTLCHVIKLHCYYYIYVIMTF